MGSGETYTIGRVVKKLQALYPDLTVSKVRFLESEGLVSPKRTKSGYRTYTDKDVERLETILRLQKTCFYPLSYIKERLEAADEGATLDELESARGDQDEARLLESNHPLEDLPDLVGVPVSFVRTLVEGGFISLLRGEGGRQLVDGHDIPLIRSAFELKRYGLDPRFLKPYLQRVNREVPAFKQVLSSIIRQGSLEDAKTRLAFDTTLDHLVALTNTVGSSLLRRELYREFNYPGVGAQSR